MTEPSRQWSAFEAGRRRAVEPSNTVRQVLLRGTAKIFVGAHRGEPYVAGQLDVIATTYL